jgi:hypothetical protein
VGRPERKRPLEDQEVGGWIMLKWILERQDSVVRTGFIRLRIEQWRALVNMVMNLWVS